jgi:flagellar protein FliS
VSYVGVARYQQNDVFSMSPARRVVFLYGQTLASLRQAARHLELGDVEQRTKCMLRASDILAEMLCSLDFEAGGSIATGLAQLYAWMMQEIVEINRLRDPKRLQRLTAMIADLHSAWDQAAAQVVDTVSSAAAGE